MQVMFSKMHYYRRMIIHDTNGKFNCCYFPLNFATVKRKIIFVRNFKPRKIILRNEQMNLTQNTRTYYYKKLIKPVCFTAFICGSSFIATSIWQYENIRETALSYRKKGEYSFDKYGQLRKRLNIYWNSLQPAEKLFWPVCAINVIIFLTWRIQKLKPFMLKYFTSNPSSGAVCIPMFLSIFSHTSLLHLSVNMYVLQSFLSGAVHFLGQEQCLFIYICSGMMASLVSHVVKITRGISVNSLGASGAIMGILAYICMQVPNAHLSIVFLPMISFTAGMALKAILLIDSAGLILGWKFFDHAAHLGGLQFGILYYFWGQQYIWKSREKIILKWHEFREKN